MKEEISSKKYIGKVINIKFDEIFNFFKDKTFNEIRKSFMEDEKIRDWGYVECSSIECISMPTRSNSFFSEEGDTFVNEKVTRSLNNVKKNFDYYKKFNYTIPIIDISENKAWAKFKIGGTIYSCLIKFMEIENFTDLSSYTGAQLIELTTTENSNNQLALPNDCSLNNAESELKKKQNEIIQLKERQTKEMKALQEELHAKERALREKMGAEMQKLIELEDNLKDQIFLLEDKIMELRCIFGESFNLIQLRKGTPCKAEHPIVIYQKLRFFDEELIRLTSLKYVNFGADDKYIEDMLTSNNKVFETFCPSDRCVTVARMTKTNTYVPDDARANWFDYIAYYRGTQIAFLIRDGENLWIAWVDEQITIKNDLFESEKSEHITLDENTKLRSGTVMKILDRKYAFIILDVLINKSKLIKLNESLKFNDSDLVIWSSADNQIDYSKYISLRDFVKKNDNTKYNTQGDSILVMQSCAGAVWRHEYKEYESRGRGDNYSFCRAHDANIQWGVNIINLKEVEHIKKYYELKEDGTKQRLSSSRDNNTKFDIEDEVHYYISCEKEYSRCNARSNIEIYTSEFINLNYISSNMIKYWIDSKKVGDWYKESYAFLCDRLKEALKYVEEREEKDFKEINKIMLFKHNEKNIDILNNWKEEKEVRTFTAFQAKRFAKSLNKN